MIAWRLPNGFPKASDVEAMALDAGVGVYALATGAAIHFGPDDESDRFLVLGFAALTERDIEAGVARLASALQDDRQIFVDMERTDEFLGVLQRIGEIGREFLREEVSIAPPRTRSPCP